jgi:chloramphenicol-sensitive protein RarD
MDAQLSRSGLWLAVGAYLIWGCFPLYFKLLGAAGPFEIVGHRVLWTFVFCLIGVAVWKQTGELRAVLRDSRLFVGLTAAGVLVSANWTIYVWGVVNDHIVDTSLGYFINPLVTVGLAVLVLKEKLRPAQWWAVSIGGLAVIIITVGYGQIPWVALSLAVSFGLYGLAKNKVGGKVSPLVGLTVETTVLAPVALAFLSWLQFAGTASFLVHGAWLTVGLVTSGVVTAVPLLMFAAAAGRIPLSVIGLIQFLTPTIQFAFGVWINHETMPAARWFGFSLVWMALVVLTVDSLLATRSHLPVGEPEVMN